MNSSLGGGSDLFVTLGGFGSARPAARTRRGFLIGFDYDRCRPISADRRRKHVERQAVVTGTVQARRLGPLVLILRSALLALEAAGTVPIAAAVGALTARGALVGSFLAAGVDQFVFAIMLVGIFTALAALILEAGAAFTEDAEIMIRVLQVIFGLDAVTRELRVARETLVFLEQLGGIAALAIVLPVPRLSAEVLPPLPTAAAPAATLTIIDQMLRPYDVVDGPLAPVGQGRAYALLLTLSFRSAHSALIERPIASGVERTRSTFLRERARSWTPM